MIEIIYTLVCTHITILCVTLYLHRSQAHRGVEFDPRIAHFMRFWLWLTTGMVTKEWVAIHRKHHRYSDVEGDPHSPHIFGIARVFTQGALLYKHAARDPVMVDTYGAGTPDDWVERNVYSRHSTAGIMLMLVIDVLLFNGWGFVIWLIQMAWIPFWAAGVINGLAHWWGYRNGTTRDQSRNILPWGIVIGGEELHNNHHLDPASPRFSLKTGEFDVGWMWIKLLERLGLARLRACDDNLLTQP